MKKPSDPFETDPLDVSWDSQLERIIGLGERSLHKSYYPQLQRRLVELERFHTLLDHSYDAVFLVDVPSGRFIDVNKSACALFARTCKVLLQMSLVDFFPPEVATSIVTPQDNGEPASKKEHILTAWYTSPQVGEILLEMTIRWVDFDALSYAVVVARDITERQRTQDALRESQRMLTNLMGNLPGMVYRSQNNRQWVMEFVSERCVDLLGYAPEDLLHNRVIAFGDLIHEDDRQRVWEEIQLALAEKRAYHCVYRVHTAGGTLKWVSEQGVGVFEPSGEFVALEGFISDITVRKQAEIEQQRAQLRIQNQRNAVIFLSAHEAVVRGQLDEALAVIVETAAKTLGVERVNVWQVDAHEGTYHCLISFDAATGFNPCQDSLKLGSDYFAALSAGFAIGVEDVTSDPRTAVLTDTYWRPFNIHSSLEAPVRLQGQVVGVICHEHRGAPRQWTADELTFAGQMADLVAQTFLNANIRHRAEELATITRFGREITADLDLHQVLYSIVQNVTQFLRADAGWVFALGPGADIVLSGYALSSEFMEILRSSGHPFLASGPLHRAITERRPVQISDLNLASDLTMPELSDLEGVRAELLVPLLREDSVVGCIVLCQKTPRYFSDDEISFASALAQQSSNVVENARLLEAERNTRQRAEILYRLAQSLITLEALSDQLQTVIESVVESLAADQVVFVLLDPATKNITDIIKGGHDAVNIPDISTDKAWDLLSEWILREESLLSPPGLLDAWGHLCDSEQLSAAPIGSQLVVPVVYQEHLFGTLFASNYAVRRKFVDQDLALMAAIANQAAAAIENSRLFTSLSHEKAHLELLYRLSRYISETLNIYDVAQRALDAICAALHTLRGYISIYLPDTSKLELLAISGYEMHVPISGFQPSDLQREKSLVGWVTEHQQSVVLDDVSTDPRWASMSNLDADVVSALCVPLLSRESIVGVLTIVSSKPAFFNAEHLKLVESAAVTVAVAIENAHFFSRAQQRAREQELISEISRALNALDVEQAYPVLAKGLRELVNCDRVSLAFLDDSKEYFSVIVLTSPLMGVPQLVPVTAMASYETIITGRAYFNADATVGSNFLRASEISYIQSYVSLPLMVGGSVIGLLNLGSRQRRAFSEIQLPLLQQVADTLAIAVENSRLFSAERHHRELAERLSETALKVNSLNLQEVMDLIMDQLESIFPYDGGTIQLLEGDVMRVIVARNLGANTVGRVYPLAEYVYNRRLADGEVIVIQDTQEDNQGWVPLNDALHVRSNIGVPLWVRDRVIGALTIDSRAVASYTHADTVLIQAFAQQAAIAVENARLFESERAQRELAEALEDAAAVISSALDFDQVLDYILDQVARVVDGDTFNIMMIEDHYAKVVRWRGYENFDMVPEIAALQILIESYPSLKKMVNEGVPIVISNTAQDPEWVMPDGPEWRRSYVAAPIRIAGTTVGFLNVNSTHGNQFDDDDAHRLQAFADHAAIAMRNANLYQQQLHYTERLEQSVRERTAQLEARNAWFEAILSSTSDGIIVTDSDGHIVQTNRVATTWLTQSLSPLDAQKLREVVRDLSRRARERPDIVIELTGLDLELNAAPISEQGSDGPAVVVAVHDVTYLTALDRMKMQFVSNVSHELRTPITSIRLYSSLIRNSSPERRERYLQALNQEADRLSRLVEDILQISRIEAGRMELNPQVVDLNVLTDTAVLSHVVLAESRGLKIKSALAPENVYALVDPEKFNQVLNNLIENAIHYTLEGGQIVVGTGKRWSEERGWALVTIKDTGIGIPEDELRQVFERFFRGESPQQMQIQGSGLGLAIVREILELHGGQVTVESAVGTGSTFTVWVPLAND